MVSPQTRVLYTMFTVFFEFLIRFSLIEICFARGGSMFFISHNFYSFDPDTQFFEKFWSVFTEA